jgi:hypothetical protein
LTVECRYIGGGGYMESTANDHDGRISSQIHRPEERSPQEREQGRITCSEKEGSNGVVSFHS